MDNKNKGRPEGREDGGGYTFFWKGKSVADHRIHGVGFFAIKNKIVRQLAELSVGINEHLVTLRLRVKKYTSYCH